MNKFRFLVLVTVTVGLLVFLWVNKSETMTSRAIPVKLQLQWYDQAQFAGFYMAKENGFYLNEGLSVNTIPGSFGTKPIEILLSGHADIAIAPADTALKAIDEGKPITLIGAVFKESVICFMSKTSDNIRTPIDFKGKKVGVYKNFDTGHVLRLLTKRYSIEDIDVRSASGDTAAFVRGDIDVWPAYIFNEPVLMAMKGIETNCITPSDYGVNYYSDSIVVRDDYLAKNPNVVRSFLKASQTGWQHAIDHQGQTIDSMYSMGLNLAPDVTSTDVQSRNWQRGMLASVAKYVDRSAGIAMLSLDKRIIVSMAESLMEAGILKQSSLNEILQKIDYSFVNRTQEKE